jgi:hypothetical protein
MISEISLCNLALAMVGEDQLLMNLDEQRKPAMLCRLHYGPSRDAMLAAVDWTCAGRRATLARRAAGPEWGFLYAYPLPTAPACLKVRTVLLDAAAMTWEREGDAILTDSTTCRIVYTAQLTDPSKFGPMLAEAIVHTLASRLAKPMCNDERLAARLRDEVTLTLLPEARRQNAGERQHPGEDGETNWAEE